MKVGFIGLGKLGFPCALAMSMKGHHVYGYDINPAAMNFDERPYKEAGPSGTGDVNDILKSDDVMIGGTQLSWGEFGKHGTFNMVGLEALCAESELIFVAIQTPHLPEFEGTTRLPYDRVDFDYDSLSLGIHNLVKHIDKPTPVVVISTVLPGTMTSRIKPLLNDNVQLCYNPFFIAMGTAMRDFLDPEFILMGVDDENAAAVTYNFYRTITKAPIHECTIEEAELTKVAYNTFIGMKIVFANTLMEICHKTDNCNVDNVTDGLKLAHRRIISPAYLSGGMGDGGGCHPRDNIALSWLARELDLSSDIFGTIMEVREEQADWLCDLLIECHDELWFNIDGIIEPGHVSGMDMRMAIERAKEKPFTILGTSFKPESNIEVGSPALLCKNILEEMDYTVVTYDPFVDTDRGFGWAGSTPPQTILIGTKHEVFKKWRFPQGSYVIDPFRYIEDQEDVNIIRVGE